MYLIPEKVKLKDAIVFANFNGLSIHPKADADVKGEDRCGSSKKNYERF